ncbi:unnamed protein product [Durusdinium trenchii]|uniref:Uncharacterized protein n=1 Tax=Durusdinium trenchii TaxID=1381693 RepID=A0ABP0IVA4_9DINO
MHHLVGSEARGLPRLGGAGRIHLGVQRRRGRGLDPPLGQPGRAGARPRPGAGPNVQSSLSEIAGDAGLVGGSGLGLGGAATGSFRSVSADRDGLPVLRRDTTFDPADPWAQRSIMDLAENMPEDLKKIPTTSFIEAFEIWLKSQNLEYPARNFHSSMNTFLESEGQGFKTFVLRDAANRVVALKLGFKIVPSFPRREVEDGWNTTHLVLEGRESPVNRRDLLRWVGRHVVCDDGLGSIFGLPQ